MDHKWGRLITAKGLGDWGIRLAARYLASPNDSYLVDRVGSPGFHWVIQVPPDTEHAYGVGQVPDVAGHPHFPYGHTVSADGPP